MFEDAIEKISESIRPVHTIIRKYKNDEITPSSSTLLFINDEGYAITTKTFIDTLILSGHMEKRYRSFREKQKELKQDRHYEKKLLALEEEFNLKQDSIIQVRSVFLDCVDTLSGYTCHKHPRYNLAILKFNDFKNLKYENHALLAKYSHSVRPGKFLCRIGFPFAEFSNFQYNEEEDTIEWTKEGKPTSPRFPMEGMITRFLGDQSGKFGIEMSTPCIGGEGGGPLFDERGIVYGLQFGTKQMKEPQIELGLCIHIDIIKKFLDYYNVKYYEA